MISKRGFIAVLSTLSLIFLFGCIGIGNSQNEVESEESQSEKSEYLDLSPAEGEFIPGTSITFSWKAVEGAENYRLRILSQSDGTVFYNRFTENSNTYTVSYFSNEGEVFCWQVMAILTEGDSDWSDEICFINGEPE